MELSIPLSQGLSLRIADQSAAAGDYPTRRLQKGLLLLDGLEELAEEGVGFGVTILKRGVQTVFPGEMELAWRREGLIWQVTAVFTMDLVERLARPGGAGLQSHVLYAAKDSLAALHRRVPSLRGPLSSASATLRRLFGWVTTYERTEVCAKLEVTYTIDGEKGSIGVSVDLSDLPHDVTEVVMMNEQGGRHFDRYTDVGGTDLRGDAIGTWDEVTAAEAGFVSTARKVAFSVRQVEGAKLSRGRELVGARLAWSGFGYSLAPPRGGFAYDVRIERMP
ncbi:MAG: hypothetical protein NTW58_03940 [Actinobacteria bacterium]|nr:hypothetical protein [Actinomycetota bacterium]